MKRRFFYLVFFLLVVRVFGESHTEYIKRSYNKSSSVIEDLFKGEKILIGNDELLTEKITDFVLCRLSREDLRLLRNMIYAKYGYIFKDDNLNYYFSLFDWYKPLFKDVDNKITETDRTNIDKIKTFEGMYDNASNDFRQLNLLTKGTWQVTPIMPSGWANTITFTEKRMEFLTSEMQDTKTFEGFSGEYSIKNGILYIYLDVLYFNHHQFEKTIVEKSNNWKNSKRNIISLSIPIELRFPISQINEEKIYEELYRNVIKIGNTEYYQFDERR